jgi:hydroxymethylbilane synthase
LKSAGDIDLVSPIYEIGVQGVFTRELDVALLANESDIAVHSLKDIPIVPAKGLLIAAVLPRGSSRDVLIYKGAIPTPDKKFVIATSSIRRRSQWLEHYPHHETENIRGNVETRIHKLQESKYDGLIMAQAAIERLDLQLKFTQTLEWMLPAPGQGAIAIVCRENDTRAIAAISQLNDATTMTIVNAERGFLHHLKGGCSAPISALAHIDGNTMTFKGALHSLDGKESFEVRKTFNSTVFADAGRLAAEEVLSSLNGRTILEEIFRTKPDLRTPD